MKTMELIKTKKMNKLVALLAILVLASCAGAPGDTEKAKRDELAKYKTELHDLNLKIAQLEKELANEEEIEYVSVKVSEIQSTLFEHFIEITGSVEADLDINVSPEGSGKIMDIVVQEGDRVEKGQTLAILNTEMLDKGIEEIKINLDLANITFQRQENLWNQKIGSEMQYLQAKTNKESLEHKLESLLAQKDMAIVKSPVNGTVDIIYQKKGEIAGAQVPFAKVVNIDNIKIYADVAESYLTKIKKGDEVFVRFPALDREIKSSIDLIGNYINPNNRTFRIKVNLKNSDHMLKPNLLSVVKIRDYVAKDAVVIPSLLIKEDFKGKYTFVSNEENGISVAKKVYVKPGVSDNNKTEITGGLEVGMKIISEGYNQVVNGTALKY